MMFYNLFFNKISCLLLIIFLDFININAEAKNISTYKNQNYNVEFHFIANNKLNNYKIVGLNNIKNPESSKSSSYDFSDFGLDDELNNAATTSHDIIISDPLESINRKFFVFSLWLDEYMFNYITNAYIKFVSKPMRISFLNAINNFNEPISIVNHLLQFKVVSFTKTTARFLINSTLGFFGFIDVASKLNLPPNYNDLAYTLNYYKIGHGFYIFLPLLGPYTLQTAVSDVTTSYVYSVTFDRLINMNSVLSVGSNLAQRGLPYIESKISLMSILDSSEDPYTLVKSAYIQNRESYFKQLKQSW